MNEVGDGKSIAIARAPRSEHIELLRERAIRLAATAGDPQAREQSVALTFTLSGERYALEAKIVREVVSLRNLTPLPKAAVPLFGMTHWRGIALTILDIRETLGLSTGGVTDLGRVLVIDTGRDPFGIVVDAVHDVIPIDGDALHPLPGADGDPSRAVVGITGDGTIVLDEDFLLAWACLGDQTNRQSGG